MNAIAQTYISSPLDRGVSVVKHAKDSSGGEHGSVRAVFDIIASDAYRSHICYLRERKLDGDTDAMHEAKQQLHGIMWGGLFHKRSNEGLKLYSGLVVLDIDDVDEPEEVRDTIGKDKHCVLAFVSPSGDGVKAVFDIGTDDVAMHAAGVLSACDYVQREYQLKADRSQRDIARLCFVSWDKGAVCNEESEPLEITSVAQAEALRHESHMEQMESSTRGEIIKKNRHAYLVAYTSRMVHLDRSCTEDEIVAACHQLKKRFDTSDGRVISDREIRDAARSAIKKFGGSVDVSVADITHGQNICKSMGIGEKAKEICGVETDGGPIEDPGKLTSDLLELPGIGKDIFDYIMRTSYLQQPDLAVGATLVACGALVGRTFETSGKGRANLYGFGVAQTGHGKDAARSALGEILLQSGADELVGAEDLASDAGLVAELKQHPARLFLLDEVGYLLGAANAKGAGAFQSNIVGNLLRLYTSSHKMWKGKAYADTQQNPVINQPHACVWATTTPGKLWDSMTVEAIDGGLLGRCLFFFGSEAKPQRRRPSASDWDVPESVTDCIREYLGQQPRGLAAMNPTPTIVEMTEEAEGIIESSFDRSEAAERLLAQSPARPLYARLTQQAERVALIYAWMRDPRGVPVLDKDAVEWGVSLVEHCTGRLAAIASRSIPYDGSPYEKTYLRVLELIRAGGEGGLTQSVLYRRCRMPTKSLQDILAAAVQAGEIGQRCIKTGGRDRRVWCAAEYCDDE